MILFKKQTKRRRDHEVFILLKQYKNEKGRPASTGFTLIELLLVIAIISLVTSILLPSLNNAKRLAVRTICMSNQRHIMLTVNVYAADYDWNLPYLEYTSGAHHPYRALGLAGYFDDNIAIIQCPGYKNFKNYFGTHPVSPMQAPIASNDAWAPDSMRNSYIWRAFAISPGAVASPLSLSDISDVSEEWYVKDWSLGPSNWGGYGAYFVGPGHCRIARKYDINIVDGEGGVVGYVDGHSDWVPVEDWTELEAYGISPETPDEFGAF